MRLALVGKPGAGKGTQGVRLAQHLGVPLISTGELLRRRAESPTAADGDLADVLARGELAPDDFVVSVVNGAVASAPGGYVLDGFPRTLAQALDPKAPALDAVIHLAVPDEVAQRRVAERAAGRADDARRDATARRLRSFHSDTEPALELYRQRGMLSTVDGTQAPELVWDAILKAVTTLDTER